MKTISILSLVLLSGCAMPDFPKFPSDVKHEYVILKDEAGVWCEKYEILSLDPYKIGNSVELPLDQCIGLSGFLVDDRKKLINYQNDIREWSKDHKCKLK